MEKRDKDIIFNSSLNWIIYRDKTVLVTGCTGRLGRFIFESLVEADIKYNLNMHIVGLARSYAKAQTIFGNTLDLPNVSIIEQDINAPIKLKNGFDFIFHTAGPAAPVDFTNPVETLWAHVNGTHNVLECARKNNTTKVFYISTVEIYGEFRAGTAITETDIGPLQHVNARACYPEAKRVCETMLVSYKKEYGIDFCGARLTHTLGPGILLNDGRAFAEFLNCALSNRDIVLHSDGSAMRTYTYVADVINAIFLIMEKGDSCFYNVAADENIISIRDLAYLISKLLPEREIKVLFSDEACNLPYLPYKLPTMDTTKIRELGWKPQVDINKTFAWTLQSFLPS